MIVIQTFNIRLAHLSETEIVRNYLSDVAWKFRIRLMLIYPG